MHKFRFIIKSLIIIFLASISTSIYSQKIFGSAIEAERIGKKAALLSYHIVNRNVEKIADIYTPDGKLFPNKTEILSGREAILEYWKPGENSTTTYHKITPEEIRVFDNDAYDYGYYEGITTHKDGRTSSWRGKYVTTWKKIDGEWKLYLDIWNQIAD